MSQSLARILIIDAVEKWQGLLERPLSGLPCQIAKAKSPEEALDKLKREQFDLAIVDIRIEPDEDVSLSLATGLMLLDDIEKQNVEIVVATHSTAPLPSGMDFVELVILVLTSYKVKDIVIKEKFNPKKYGEKIENIIKIVYPTNSGLKRKDREILQDILANISSWELGQPHQRAGILMAAGIPKDLITDLRLDSSPQIDAAITINVVSRVDYTIEIPEYTGLGLLVKYLYNNHSHDITNRSFCARLFADYELTKDEAFLKEIRPYLPQTVG